MCFEELAVLWMKKMTKSLKVRLLYILHKKIQVQLIPKISGINMSDAGESPT